MDKTQTGLNHNNARTKEQIALMRKIEEDGVCPFCKEHFTTYHPKPILRETDYWFVTENISPYEGTTLHLIFVYKPAHVISPEKASPEALADLFENINWAINTYTITGGSMFMRFGDTSYNGSSVEHLHAQLVVGVPESESNEKIRVKLGWQKSG